MSDSSTIHVEVQQENMPRTRFPLTDDLKRRVLENTESPFHKAIFEYLFDAERTIQPPVGKIVLGSAMRINRETKERQEINNAIAVFPEGKDTPQILGTAEDLGVLVVNIAATGAITPAETLPVFLSFRKIENFEAYYFNGAFKEPEGCTGDCENCTLHDEPQASAAPEPVVMPGAPSLQDIHADLLLRSMPDDDRGH